MATQIERIESALAGYVPETDKLYKTVTNAMRYSLLNGGKRVRAVLALEFCKLCGGTEEMAMPFACAVEMVHAYSLIHDDLPCMDNDAMRRGKPSNHMVFGENYALLAGDGLLTKAFETALSPKAFQVAGIENAAKAAAVLAECSGEYGMVGGQCIDLETEDREVSLEVLYAKDTGKTANLIMAACMMGCIAAGADENLIEAAKFYALNIGLAFQMRDDILDVIGNAEVLGKNVGVDAHNGRCTYVSLMGIEKAQKMVNRYTQDALEVLSVFPGDAAFLREFAVKLAERTK